MLTGEFVLCLSLYIVHTKSCIAEIMKNTYLVCVDDVLDVLKWFSLIIVT